MQTYTYAPNHLYFRYCVIVILYFGIGFYTLVCVNSWFDYYG